MRQTAARCGEHQHAYNHQQQAYQQHHQRWRGHGGGGA